MSGRSSRVLALSLLVLGLAGCGRDERSAFVPPDLGTWSGEAQVAAKIRAAREAVLAEPESAAAVGRLAMAFHAHELYAEAVACYRRAEALAPADARWPYLEALATAKDDLAAATAPFERTVALGPREPAIYVNFGDLLVQLGRAADAEAQYRRALALAPESTHALLGLARIDLAGGDPAAAAGLLERAASVAPWHGEVHGLLAQAYRRLGRADDAELELLRAGAFPQTTRAPDPILAAMEAEGVGSRAASERGQRLADDGRFAEAEGEFRKVLAIRPATVRDLSNLGGALAGQGQFVAAIAEYEKALALDPADAVTLNNLGMALAGQGDLAAANRRLRRALEIDPAYAEAHRNLGLVLARQGRPEAAIAAYREALARNPSLAGAENDLGTALAGRGRIDQAMEHWRRALAIDPRELSALYNLSAALIQRGEHGEAIDRLRRGMATAPNSSRLATLLAWELASAPDPALRDAAEAERLARRVHDAYPDQPQAADLLAASLAAQGRFAEAIPLAERALARAKGLQQVDLVVQIAGRLGLYRRGEAFVQGATG